MESMSAKWSTALSSTTESFVLWSTIAFRVRGPVRSDCILETSFSQPALLALLALFWFGHFLSRDSNVVLITCGLFMI